MIEKKSPIMVLILIILLLGLTFLEGVLYSQRVKSGLLTTTLPVKAGQNFWNFLGSLRTIAAAYLWIRVDRIHHKYYRDLRREQELVPYYRIITWLDPSWVDAYYVGSYLLYIYKQPEESLKFAKEGVKFNPNSAKLNFNLGQLYILTKNYHKSLPPLNKALRLTKDEREKLAAYQLLYVAYKNLKKFKEAEEVLKKAKQLQGKLEDEPLKKLRLLYG